MIIECPCKKKKFNIDINLIPAEGRNLQCGSCDRVWFYKKEDPIPETPLINEDIAIKENEEINNLFDIVINKTSLDEEIKYLIIYKKALYNADNSNENELLEILKPLINSKSVWKSHGLYLMAEYFFTKNEKQKSKEFFNQILSLENANPDLVREAQKRLNRDISE